MARRAPPTHRPDQSATSRDEPSQRSRAEGAKLARPKTIDFLSKPEGAPSEPARSTIPHLQEIHEDTSDDRDTNENSDPDEEDIGGPRVAQWIDDEELERQEQMDDDASANQDSEGVDGDDHSTGQAGPSNRLRSLEDDLSMLPLGTLRSAQRSLAYVQALSSTESDSEEQSEGDSNVLDDDISPAKGKVKEKPGKSSKSKNNLTERTNKHAPAEVTSKRQVSRRRVVVDNKLPKPRDPRFMRAAGRYDPSKFKQQYDFLSDLHNDELLTLRGHVKRARKLLANSPLHVRAEREEEVKRLEYAMKRAESAVNLDNRERVELKALQSAKKTEEEKRKQGKARWWMKQSEKQALFAKARLEAIAAAGGKQAVKKAVEKKQKKIGQKEKKMRPFPRSEGIEWSNGKRRRPVGSDDPGVKRRKVV